MSAAAGLGLVQRLTGLVHGVQNAAVPRRIDNALHVFAITPLQAQDFAGNALRLWQHFHRKVKQKGTVERHSSGVDAVNGGMR